MRAGNKKNMGAVLKRLMAYILKKYKWQCLLVALCILVSTAANIGGTLFVRAWPCSPLRSFSLIRKTELWRTNKPPALRVVKIALALCKKPPLI